jgi:hypothetical protein
MSNFLHILIKRSDAINFVHAPMLFLASRRAINHEASRAHPKLSSFRFKFEANGAVALREKNYYKTDSPFGK